MTATMKTRRAVYVQPKVQRFDHRQEAKLITELRMMDEHTSLRGLTDPSEFQLDKQGKTIRGGFRFTAPAFSQAAQLMAPGLSKLLPDLSGTVSLKDDRDHLVDSVTAINFWNEIVDLRFSLFRRHRLIRNDVDKTIEGLVGHAHQYLENWALYQSAVLALQEQDVPAQMYAATLIGRLFSVWFRATTPLFVLNVAGTDWPIYAGYYFTNGEATGTAVRGTAAIFTPKGVCLGNYKKYGRRVTHTGRDFQVRLGQAFSDICQAELPVDKLREGIAKLATASLGFSDGQTRNARIEHMKKLTTSLSLCGVVNKLAKEVVELGVTAGRTYGQDEIAQSRYINTAYSDRTLLDLYVPLLGIARKISIRQREKLECAAFNILTDKFNL